MRCYFLRHGETVEWAAGIILGSLPGTLSKRGKSDTEKLAGPLQQSGIRFSRIVSSDLARAKETAKILSDRLGIPVETDSLLRERSGGTAEGKREDEIDWALYERRAFPYRKHAGGESFLDVKKRARAFLGSLPEKSDENILVVSHSVFIGMVCAAVTKTSMERSVKINATEGIPMYDTKKRTLEFVRLP